MSEYYALEMAPDRPDDHFENGIGSVGSFREMIRLRDAYRALGGLSDPDSCRVEAITSCGLTLGAEDTMLLLEMDHVLLEAMLGVEDRTRGHSAKDELASKRASFFRSKAREALIAYVTQCVTPVSLRRLDRHGYVLVEFYLKRYALFNADPLAAPTEETLSPVNPKLAAKLKEICQK